MQRIYRPSKQQLVENDGTQKPAELGTDDRGCNSQWEILRFRRLKTSVIRAAALTFLRNPEPLAIPTWLFDQWSARFRLFCEPCLDQGLIGNIPFVGGNFDTFKEYHRQT
jgi:hypothetical protein